VNVPENILFIRLKSIGDVVFTLPAVHVVRQNFPAARLHFLVSKQIAPLLSGFSEIDEVIVYDREAFYSKSLPDMGASAFRLVRELRKKRFSLVIDLQGYGETGWLSWLSGAPERWCSVYRYARGWAYTRSAWRDETIHPAEGHLALLHRCGLSIGEVRNEYVLPAEAMAGARKFFAVNGLEENKPTLFLQPFTSTPSHNWPLENFLVLAQQFQTKCQIIFGGGPSEREALKPAMEAGFVVSAGTPLLVTASLIKLSSLTIGADTGLMHVAVATGARVVMLMPQAGSPARPFRHADWAVLPAKDKTVADVSVEEVVAQCERALP
jgi:ADP-heptose:LPS heptosyltransferase